MLLHWLSLSLLYGLTFTHILTVYLLPSCEWLTQVTWPVWMNQSQSRKGKAYQRGQNTRSLVAILILVFGFLYVFECQGMIRVVSLFDFSEIEMIGKMYITCVWALQGKTISHNLILSVFIICTLCSFSTSHPVVNGFFWMFLFDILQNVTTEWLSRNDHKQKASTVKRHT